MGLNINLDNFVAIFVDFDDFNDNLAILQPDRLGTGEAAEVLGGVFFEIGTFLK